MVPAQVLGAFRGGWRAQKELKHDAEKWKSVFRQDHAPLRKKLEVQSIQLETIAL